MVYEEFFNRVTEQYGSNSKKAYCLWKMKQTGCTLTEAKSSYTKFHLKAKKQLTNEFGEEFMIGKHLHNIGSTPKDYERLEMYVPINGNAVHKVHSAKVQYSNCGQETFKVIPMRYKQLIYDLYKDGKTFTEIYDLLGRSIGEGSIFRAVHNKLLKRLDKGGNNDN